MTAQRLSLWALPCEEDAARYREVIERLSRECGTEPFEPHITLTGSIEDATTKAFDVTFDTIADSDQRFQCITLRTSAVGPLAAVNGPHLSLVYASLHEAARRKLKDTIDLPLPHTARFEAVSLVSITDDIREWTEVERRTLEP